MKKITVSLDGERSPDDLHESLKRHFSPKYKVDRTDWQTSVDFSIRSNRWVIARLQIRQWGGRTEALIEDDISANEGLLRNSTAILYLLPFLIVMPLFIYLGLNEIYIYGLLMVLALVLFFRLFIAFRRMALKREVADFLRGEGMEESRPVTA